MTNIIQKESYFTYALQSSLQYDQIDQILIDTQFYYEKTADLLSIGHYPNKVIVCNHV